MLFLSLAIPGKKERGGLRSDDVAEIEGAVWKQLSVFEHIESSLSQRPNGPAITCLFEPTPDLQELVGRFPDPRKYVEDVSSTPSYDQSNETYEKNGLNHFTGVDGNNGCPTHKKSGLWERAHNEINGITTNGSHKSISPPLSAAPDKLHDGVNGMSPTLFEKQITSPSVPVSTLTYRVLYATALRLAAGLLANGSRSNTTVIMLIPNGGEYTVFLWTCILLRITYVSVDPSILDISGFTMLKHTLQSIKPQLVVVPDAIAGTMIFAVKIFHEVQYKEHPRVIEWFLRVYEELMFQSVARELEPLSVPYPKLPEHLQEGDTTAEHGHEQGWKQEVKVTEREEVNIA